MPDKKRNMNINLWLENVRKGWKGGKKIRDPVPLWIHIHPTASVHPAPLTQVEVGEGRVSSMADEKGFLEFTDLLRCFMTDDGNLVEGRPVDWGRVV